MDLYFIQVLYGTRDEVRSHSDCMIQGWEDSSCPKEGNRWLVSIPQKWPLGSDCELGDLPSQFVVSYCLVHNIYIFSNTPFLSHSATDQPYLEWFLCVLGGASIYEYLLSAWLWEGFGDTKSGSTWSLSSRHSNTCTYIIITARVWLIFLNLTV